MIDFSKYPLSENTLRELAKLKIDFVFQPIFRLSDDKIMACEALMRPEGMSPLELIELYEQRGNLHILELATYFGATETYYKRGYSWSISINSFPSEVFRPEESAAYFQSFPDTISQRLIVELLEYPRFIPHYWDLKKRQISDHNILVALDDFGSGYNNLTTVKLINPHIIKLDRELISDIHKSPAKAQNLMKLIDILHQNGYELLAEGIETKEEYDFIKNTDIEYAQGYYLAKPE